MPSPMSTTLIGLGAVLTAWNAVAGAIVAGLGALLEILVSGGPSITS